MYKYSRALEILLIVLFVYCIQACSSMNAVQTQAQSHILIGSWEGKWDDTWRLKFDISSLDNERVLIVYEWEEVLGEPVVTQKFTAWIKGTETVSNGFITISIDQEATDKAMAVGKFEKTRKATLKRRK